MSVRRITTFLFLFFGLLSVSVCSYGLIVPPGEGVPSAPQYLRESTEDLGGAWHVTLQWANPEEYIGSTGVPDYYEISFANYYLNSSNLPPNPFHEVVDHVPGQGYPTSEILYEFPPYLEPGEYFIYVAACNYSGCSGPESAYVKLSLGTGFGIQNLSGPSQAPSGTATLLWDLVADPNVMYLEVYADGMPLASYATGNALLAEQTGFVYTATGTSGNRYLQVAPCVYDPSIPDPPPASIVCGPRTGITIFMGPQVPSNFGGLILPTKSRHGFTRTLRSNFVHTAQG